MAPFSRIYHTLCLMSSLSDQIRKSFYSAVAQFDIRQNLKNAPSLNSGFSATGADSS